MIERRKNFTVDAFPFLPRFFYREEVPQHVVVQINAGRIVEGCHQKPLIIGAPLFGYQVNIGDKRSHPETEPGKCKCAIWHSWRKQPDGAVGKIPEINEGAGVLSHPAIRRFVKNVLNVADRFLLIRFEHFPVDVIGGKRARCCVYQKPLPATVRGFLESLVNEYGKRKSDNVAAGEIKLFVNDGAHMLKLIPLVLSLHSLKRSEGSHIEAVSESGNNVSSLNGERSQITNYPNIGINLSRFIPQEAEVREYILSRFARNLILAFPFTNQIRPAVSSCVQGGDKLKSCAAIVRPDMDKSKLRHFVQDVAHQLAIMRLHCGMCHRQGVAGTKALTRMIYAGAPQERILAPEFIRHRAR